MQNIKRKLTDEPFHHNTKDKGNRIRIEKIIKRTQDNDHILSTALRKLKSVITQNELCW